MLGHSLRESKGNKKLGWYIIRIITCHRIYIWNIRAKGWYFSWNFSIMATHSHKKMCFTLWNTRSYIKHVISISEGMIAWFYSKNLSMFIVDFGNTSSLWEGLIRFYFKLDVWVALLLFQFSSKPFSMPMDSQSFTVFSSYKLYKPTELRRCSTSLVCYLIYQNSICWVPLHLQRRYTLRTARQ